MVKTMRGGPSVRVTVAALLFGALGAAGCGGSPLKVPCMTLSGPSELVNRAGALRLDLYAATVHCDGAGVPADAAPISTNLFAPNQPITREVPPGHHAVVLTSYADSAATTATGRGCRESDFGAGAQVCLDLTLAPLSPSPDGGCGSACPCSSSPDSCPAGQFCATDGQCAPGCRVDADCSATPSQPRCDLSRHQCAQCLADTDCPTGQSCASGQCAPRCDPARGLLCPSGSSCCNQVCADLRSDIANCGACGRACAVDHVVTTACAAGVCSSSCAAGWGNCSQPSAPGADDGCESHTDVDANHCGLCSNTCPLPAHTSGATCAAASCGFASCSNNYQSCDGNAANGCECAGTGCCGSKCQSAHSNGEGQSFYDCVALGTINQTQAMAACAAFTGDGTQCQALTCTSGKATGELSVCSVRSPTSCSCWAYGGLGSGHVYNAGAPGFNSCGCVFATDPSWN